MYFARMLTNQKQADKSSLEYASDHLHETATSFVLSSRGERNCGLVVGHTGGSQIAKVISAPFTSYTPIDCG